MSGFCLERKRERKESSGMRDTGRQSGGASNQWPACFAEVCVCMRCAHQGMFVCVTAGVCVAQCEALCRASRLKLCKQVTMSKLNLRTLTYTHTYTHASPAQGQAQRQGSRGVLAVGGSEKQIMINWLTFYKTLPLMHLG